MDIKKPDLENLCLVTVVGKTYLGILEKNDPESPTVILKDAMEIGSHITSDLGEYVVRLNADELECLNVNGETSGTSSLSDKQRGLLKVSVLHLEIGRAARLRSQLDEEMKLGKSTSSVVSRSR